MHGDQPLAEHFRRFAATVERDGGTTYATITRSVANDQGVLSLLDGAPLMQRRPLLLLAAVHFLLLSGVGHPLADFYDTVRLVRGLPAGRTSSGDVAAAFTDFCGGHRAELERLIATRSTQTNEIGRCTALLPGLGHIAAQYGWGEPLSVLDLGTSAGLNLLFDDYGYTYRSPEGAIVRTAGAPGATVALECTVRGTVTDLPELRLPDVAARRRSRSCPGRPVLRRRGPLAAGLSMARQPAPVRALARRVGQCAVLDAPAAPAAR